MDNLGFVEVLAVAMVALLVFGPERLPELARKAGRFIARSRAEASRAVEELKRTADLQGLDDELRGLSDEVREVRATVIDAVSAGTTERAMPPVEDQAPL